MANARKIQPKPKSRKSVLKSHKRNFKNLLLLKKLESEVQSNGTQK